MLFKIIICFIIIIKGGRGGRREQEVQLTCDVACSRVCGLHCEAGASCGLRRGGGVAVLRFGSGALLREEMLEVGKRCSFSLEKFSSRHQRL